jgi:hypothetical protein
MPARPRSAPGTIATHFDEILAMVAAGHPLERVLRSDPKFPSKPGFQCFLKHPKHPDRRQRLKAAQSQGKEHPVPTTFYSEEHFDHSLNVIEGSDQKIRLRDLRIEGGPSYRTLCVRAEREPEFAARLKAAQGQRRRGGGHHKYFEENYNNAISLIKKTSLAFYKRVARDRGLPCTRTVWVNTTKNHEFRTRYGAAVEVAVSSELRRSRTERLARKQEWRAKKHAQHPKTALLSNDLYQRVNATIPKGLEPETREDVISDVILAVLSGEIGDHEIATRCAEFVKRHNRNFSPYETTSLDAPIFDGPKSSNMLDHLTTDPVAYWGY